MKPWVIYAVLSAAFAGATGVVAKIGLTGISGEVGLLFRTGLVLVCILGFSWFAVKPDQLAAINGTNVRWLALSAILTSCSWIFYFKALKEGDVSKIALIDKGSILIAVFLGWAILKEEITLRTIFGGGLVLLGIFIISKSRS